MFMKNMCLLPVWAVLLIIAGTFFSCEKKKDMAIYRQADSLNLLSYHMRYKNLDTACKAAHDAYKLADGFPSLRAGALNNQVSAPLSTWTLKKPKIFFFAYMRSQTMNWNV